MLKFNVILGGCLNIGYFRLEVSLSDLKTARFYMNIISLIWLSIITIYIYISLLSIKITKLDDTCCECVYKTVYDKWFGLFMYFEVGVLSILTLNIWTIAPWSKNQDPRWVKEVYVCFILISSIWTNAPWSRNQDPRWVLKKCFQEVFMKCVICVCKGEESDSLSMFIKRWARGP